MRPRKAKNEDIDVNERKSPWAKQIECRSKRNGKSTLFFLSISICLLSPPLDRDMFPSTSHFSSTRFQRKNCFLHWMSVQVNQSSSRAVRCKCCACELISTGLSDDETSSSWSDETRRTRRGMSDLDPFVSAPFPNRFSPIEEDIRRIDV
jgi:hypothetical protein